MLQYSKLRLQPITKLQPIEWKRFFFRQGMTVIIRDHKHFKVAEKQLQILLGFVEEDIHDHIKQGAAFPLLKVILLFLVSLHIGLSAKDAEGGQFSQLAALV